MLMRMTIVATMRPSVTTKPMTPGVTRSGSNGVVGLGDGVAAWRKYRTIALLEPNSLEAA
jgi:hypothetical protein